ADHAAALAVSLAPQYRGRSEVLHLVGGPLVARRARRPVPTHPVRGHPHHDGDDDRQHAHHGHAPSLRRHVSARPALLTGPRRQPVLPLLPRPIPRRECAAAPRHTGPRTAGGTVTPSAW